MKGSDTKWLGSGWCPMTDAIAVKSVIEKFREKYEAKDVKVSGT